MSPHQWYLTAEFWDWRGHRIALRHGGDEGGAKILLIHGFPTASWDWHRIWPLLGARFELLAPDLLGFGWSDKPRGHDYSITEQADLLETLVRDRGWRSFALLAHDYGDSVAQELLARAPRAEYTVTHCVMLNGGIIPSAHRATVLQRVLASPVGPLLMPLVREPLFRRSFARIFGPHTRPSDQELGWCWQLIDKNRGRRVIPRLLSYLQERRRNAPRWTKVLVEPTVPLMMINGALDPISGAHMMAALASLDGPARIETLAQVGHYPQLEAPGAVAALTTQFIGHR